MDKGVQTFPNGICPKGNVIAQLESELAYYNSTVHRFNHYTTRAHSRTFLLWQHSITSYKTIKANSVFCLNFCAYVKPIQRLEVHKNSKILVRLRTVRIRISYIYIYIYIYIYLTSITSRCFADI